MAWAPDYESWYDPRPRAYGPTDPGGGPPHPGILKEHGVASRDWYMDGDPKGDDLRTWAHMLKYWDVLEADFQWHYGIDLASGILKKRSFRWFTIRVVKLMSEDTGFRRELGV